MPQLVLFRRRWNFASDDFVHYSLRLIICFLGITLLVILAFVIRGPYMHNAAGEVAVYVNTCLAGLALLCHIALACYSSIGLIFDVKRKRRFLPEFYFFTIILAFISLGFNIYLLSVINPSWPGDVPTLNSLQAGAGIGIIINAFVVIYFLIHWDPHGGTQNEEHRKRVIKRRVKRAKRVLVGRNDDSSWERLGDLFAHFLQGNDLVFSDLVAGMSLLNQQTLTMIGDTPLATTQIEAVSDPDASGIDLQQVRQVWKFAAATYGWLNKISADPVAAKKMRRLEGCCGCHPSWEQTYFEREYYDKVSNLNEYYRMMIAALLACTDARSEEVIYVSEPHTGESTFEPVFVVGASEKLRALVIAIRGTFDISDCVTDTMAFGDEMHEEEMPQQVTGGPFLIHGGILRSARILLRTLDSKRVLDNGFSALPSNYQLIVTGHSLGGGVALALGLLLKNRYPELKVFAFAPPLGTLCERAANYMTEWTLVVVNEKCMFSRMSYYTLLDLKKRMIAALEACQIPKYRLLEKTYCSLLGCTRAKMGTDSEEYGHRLAEPRSLVHFLRRDFYGEITSEELDQEMPKLSGHRVLLLVRRVERGRPAQAVLVGAEQLQTLLVHRTMLTDHFLKSINESLDKLCEQIHVTGVRKLKEQ